MPTNQEIVTALNHISSLEPFASISEARISRGGGLSLAYCAVSFRYKHARWPKDYPELSDFVKASDGYLFLSGYQKVRLNVLTNDALEFHYVREGHTNETNLTIGPPLEKN